MLSKFKCDEMYYNVTLMLKYQHDLYGSFSKYIEYNIP